MLSLRLESQNTFDRFMTKKDSFHSTRFWLFASGSTVITTGALISLNNVWYAQYPRSSFHFFNDMGEWENMDKFGHVFTAYFQANLIYNGYSWAGVKNKKAAWAGFITATLYQGALEYLDGTSTNWGFSVPDFLSNEIGAGIFLTQQLTWKEQRIRLKYSNTSYTYSNNLIYSTDGQSSISYKKRTNDLFGKSYSQTFFKDYNASTVWLSVNPASFCNQKPNWLPSWLNLAVGFGANNLYGGFKNEFEIDGKNFIVNHNIERQRQYFLSFDVDLSKVKSNNKLLKTFLNIFNIIKIPSPTLEYNSSGYFKFHPIYF